MKVFEKMEKFSHEQIVCFYGDEAGLKGITCIRDTTLDPAIRRN